MTTKQDFDSEQWQLLIDVPPLAGTAVMVAGKSGLGTLKEAAAVAKSVIGVRNEYGDNSLIQALLHARLEEKDRSAIEKRDSKLLAMDSEQLANETVARCQQVRVLVDTVCEPAEAAGYKQWVVDVANQVANAAKEGGLLGIGGQRVSQGEADMIQRIQKALELI